MIRVELEKNLFRLRTYLLLAVIAAFPALLTLIFSLGGTPTHAGAERNFIVLAPESGLNLTLATLGHASDLILPLVGVILVGSAIAEEASWGTLSYLLVRPVTRVRLLVSKLVVVAALILAAAIIVTLLAVVDGVVAFGWRPVVTPSGSTLAADTALARIAVVAPYIAWSLAGVMSVGFLVSTLSNSPLYAAAAAFGMATASQILDSLSALGDVRNFLPTHYWRAWEDLFARTASWDDILVGSLVQLPYVIVFIALAFWSFCKKDVLT